MASYKVAPILGYRWTIAMPRSLNRIELIGRLGADPELCAVKAGLHVCTCWLVTEDLWKDQTGTMYEAVEWHRLVLWERLAEECYHFFVRGDLLYVEGLSQTVRGTIQHSIHIW